MIEYLRSIGIEAKKINIYELAFIHKSYGNENEIDNNERLEFLGDAVLELFVTEFLYKYFKNATEGKMTSLRSNIVRKKSLADLARKLELGKCIKLSKGEKNGYKKDYILANTFEALLGAMYLDRGMKFTKSFLEINLFPSIIESERKNAYIGPKSKFQEFIQAEVGITPSYELISSSGPDHETVFIMGLFLNDIKISEGFGSSKRLAESNAAENALLIDKKTLNKILTNNAENL
jgi:ribonuclease-3